jgi:hypothetical protein
VTAGRQVTTTYFVIPAKVFSLIPANAPSRHPGESRDPAPLQSDWCRALDSGFRRNDGRRAGPGASTPPFLYPPFPYLVIPAKAGIQLLCGSIGAGHWIPAFAGMTSEIPPPFSYLVIPAKAGIQLLCGSIGAAHWIPAFAGMTGVWGVFPRRSFVSSSWLEAVRHSLAGSRPAQPVRSH